MNTIITSLASLLCVMSPVKEARPDASYAHAVRLSAILMTESGGRENVTSPKGALGPMQLMPITIKELQTAGDVPPHCRPAGDWRRKVQTFEFGLHWGACYVELLESRGFVGISTLIAYNAGPTWARRWRKTGRMPAETATYIERVTDIERQCLSNKEGAGE